MKTTKMSTILVLALGLMVCFAQFSQAAPMGTAFTYQGRLLDANSPAEGIYDAIFVLYDLPEGPNELGVTEIQNFAVFDGYFTVELDFGSNVFDGSERWLEVYVRPGDFNDPCGHTILWPRQKITPTPYAIYAKTAGGGLSLPYEGTVDSNDPAFSVTNKGNGSGVYAWSQDGFGVWAGSLSTDSDLAAVYGRAAYTHGVYGQTLSGSAHGVYGEAAGYSTGAGVKGESGVGHGVIGNTNAYNKAGVYGWSENGIGVKGRSDKENGVVGWTGDPNMSGVFGHSQVGIGVLGRSDGDAGVTAVTTSTNPDQAALVARNTGSGLAIYAESGTNGLAAVFNGTIKTNVLEIIGGSDLSEQFDVNGRGEEVKPGMVVSIDPQNPGKLVVSNKAYDRRVAGIISGAGGIKAGMLMGQKGSKADGTHPVALTGRVYCWADASYGKIQPGDLLTTSNTPGHAMKVRDFTKFQGAVLGKAMSSLDESKGLVLVLVSLQ